MDEINIEFLDETIALEFVDVGPPGVPGVGVPEGGVDGQVLAKASDDDYDTE